MRLLFLSLAVFVMLLVVAFQQAAAQVETTTCAVSANYHEAWDENSFELLKLLSMVNSPTSPLDNPATGGIFLSQLVSIRHYHEASRATLPDCAQAINNAIIQTVSATQDVLAFMLAQDANPTSKRYVNRIESATNHLNQQWQSLTQLTRQTSLGASE